MLLISVVLGITVFSNAGEVEMFYDDGIPSSFYQGIGWCGVWFNVEDFLPAGTEVDLTSVEMWFLHDSSYPWDTSEFYMEIWSGIMPSSQLCQISVLAESNAAVTVDVSSENITVDSDFWILKNSELSAGGWPSLACDNSPPTVPHSSSSGWPDAWITSGDLYMRCSGEVLNSLEGVSWASLKTVF